MWMDILTAGILAAETLRDLRTREISLAAAALLGAAGLLSGLLQGRTLYQWLFCAGIGGLFPAVSFLSGGRLGYGDGWMILALSLAAGGERILPVLYLAFLGCAAAAFVSVRSRKEKEVPLVPFLFLGWTAELLLPMIA